MSTGPVMILPTNNNVQHCHELRRIATMYSDIFEVEIEFVEICWAAYLRLRRFWCELWQEFGVSLDWWHTSKWNLHINNRRCSTHNSWVKARGTNGSENGCKIYFDYILDNIIIGRTSTRFWAQIDESGRSAAAMVLEKLQPASLSLSGLSSYRWEDASTVPGGRSTQHMLLRNVSAISSLDGSRVFFGWPASLQQGRGTMGEYGVTNARREIVRRWKWFRSEISVTGLRRLIERRAHEWIPLHSYSLVGKSWDTEEGVCQERCDRGSVQDSRWFCENDVRMAVSCEGWSFFETLQRHRPGVANREFCFDYGVVGWPFPTGRLASPMNVLIFDASTGVYWTAPRYLGSKRSAFLALKWLDRIAVHAPCRLKCSMVTRSTQHSQAIVFYSDGTEVPAQMTPQNRRRIFHQHPCSLVSLRSKRACVTNHFAPGCPSPSRATCAQTACHISRELRSIFSACQCRRPYALGLPLLYIYSVRMDGSMVSLGWASFT